MAGCTAFMRAVLPTPAGPTMVMTSVFDLRLYLWLFLRRVIIPGNVSVTGGNPPEKLLSRSDKTSRGPILESPRPRARFPKRLVLLPYPGVKAPSNPIVVELLRDSRK